MTHNAMLDDMNRKVIALRRFVGGMPIRLIACPAITGTFVCMGPGSGQATVQIDSTECHLDAAKIEPLPPPPGRVAR